MKRAAQIMLVFALAFATLGADSSSARFEKLGHRLMCTCGCNQILLECNHVGCPVSGGMRDELSAVLNKNTNDDAVLSVFVQKYGPVVLAAPTLVGFDRVAWVAPYAAFALGLALVVFIVRHWKYRPAATSPGLAGNDPMLQDFRRKAREETEL